MKKAQAAMEFLMTYGWSIMVVILVGGALVYFDVLNPAKFLPDRCQIQGFMCTEFKVNANNAQLYLTNTIGDDIIITNVTISTASNSDVINLRIGKSELITVNISSLGVKQGDRFKETIKIAYSTTTGLGHTNTGEIITNVAAGWSGDNPRNQEN